MIWAEADVNQVLYLVREREKIRLARAAGKPGPWTDDPVLRTCHFCNVFQEHDRVSAWLFP